MARGFSSRDAKRLITKHKTYLNKLKAVSEFENEYRDKVSVAAEKLAVAQVMALLRDIPVEELNRDKRGIKTKTLRDNGYCSFADVYGADINRLIAVKGISDEGAAIIKEVVDQYVDDARRNAKIRLSADDRSYAATELVRAVFSYHKSLKVADAAKELLLYNGDTVNDAILDLGPAANGLRWLFSSKSAKEKAENAYSTLYQLSRGEYFLNVNHQILEADRLLRLPANEAWNDFSENSVQYFTVIEQIVPGLLGTDDSVYGLPDELASEIRNEGVLPEGLRCSLRRYQEWGVKYILHQKRVLLGDEMGLGKTIQAIAAMVSLRNMGATHFAVVCPASVITNWCREIGKHSTLKAVKIHGSGREGALSEWLSNGGIAVTTYETTGHFSLNDDFRFSMLVVDEAHYIKNPEARRSINTVKLSKHAERILFMTGTALENKVDEMIELISHLQPKIANDVRNIAVMPSAPQFREKIAPVYYRRRREDVLTELPDLIENKEWCTLLPEEEKIYEKSVLQRRYADARRVSWNVGDPHKSSKAKRLMEIVEEAEAEDRKVIVFSFFLDTLRTINSFLGERCVNSINGSVSPSRRQEMIDEFDKAPAGSVLT
ncbi:MAG: DEAD/DEAH box helicase, partial [Clostridia bacterium]|nr:DEAD/DEAH box helicase [Clostridia bacterium]